MSTLSRKTLLGAFALMATLSAPLAFAQSAEASAEAAPPTASAEAAPPTASAEAAPPTEAAAQAEAGPAAAAATGTAPVKKSWSDVDTDKDGNLTRSEASTVPALAQVFDQADGDGDGTLTTAEYKAYVAKVQGGDANKDGGK